MAGIFHRLSLLLIALALAVTPLRGAFAQTALSASPSERHCTQIAHGMHAPGNPVGGHDCGRNCKGSCCGSACACLHAAAAIPASPWTMAAPSAAARHIPSFPDITQRCLPPPFRPPVSATS